MFCDTINNPNTQTVILAQDETNSKKLFQMVHRFYETLAPSKKRKTGRQSTTEIWWPDIDSYFFVGWAGSKKVGRGGTTNNVHLSEPAHYETNSDELYSGILQSVPKDGNIFQETTANGLDAFFYPEYQDALEGESIYTPRFFPWFFEPEYQDYQTIQGRYTVETFVLTREEEMLREVVMKEYNILLSIPQLIWRRNKTLELKNSKKFQDGEIKVGSFPQEFPSNAEEAFILTGNPVFDVEFITKELLPRCKNPISKSEWRIPAIYADLRSLEDYQLEIFKTPLLGHRYIVTADPAEGLNDDGDHDFCSADVIDFDTQEQVMTLHGRWEPAEFAKLLNLLGRWFNNALLIVERNNHGHSVLNSLVNTYEYPKAYQMEGWGGLYYHQEYDGSSKVKSLKAGFPTNEKTKAIAFGHFTNLLADDGIQINSKASLRQMRVFVKLPNGKLGGNKSHDDRVSSLALGAFILKDMLFNKKALRKEEKMRQKKAGRAVGLIKASNGNSGYIV